MEDIYKTRKSLETILKKGDLYDVIATRQNRRPRKNAFFKTQVLIFSRILYAGVLLVDKIKSFFSPIEEVKKAQDQIRADLGINVDIVKSKEQWNINRFAPIFSSQLAILYEAENLSMAEYFNNLQKIQTFCEIYGIDKIYLSKFAIQNIFPDVDLSDFEKCFKNDPVLVYRQNNKNGELLVLNNKELLELIKRLKAVGIDSRIIDYFKNGITDEAVKKAIDDFYLDKNFELLKKIINSRLTLAINSDNLEKNKIDGTVLKDVTINDEFIKVLTRTKEGKYVFTEVLSLYDYFEVVNYRGLLEKIDGYNDDNQLYLLASLYIYLCQFQKVKVNSGQELSTYETLYQKYLENNKISSSSLKTMNNMLSIILSGGFTFFVIAIFLLTGTCAEVTINYLFHANTFPLKTFVNTIQNIYDKSAELEKELLNEVKAVAKEKNISPEDLSNLINGFSNSNNYFDSELSPKTGDAKNKSDRSIAYVIRSSTDIEPSYYASSYATSATYDKGAYTYALKPISLDENLFAEGNEKNLYLYIKYNINPKELKASINDNKLILNNIIFPLGDNYGLFSITIYNESGNVILDFYRVKNNGLYLTEDEKNLLLSMTNPEVVLSYGINDYENTLSNVISKDASYTSILPEESRIAVIKGLGLNKDATDEEIYEAIRDKWYSTTPIADAGLTRKVKKMEEVEFLETVASMDSLVCNLAATLATTTNDELIYTAGFYAPNQAVIRKSYAHAWAMTKECEIIEVTPANVRDKEEEKSVLNIIDKVLDWAVDNSLPTCAIIALIAAVVNHFFGDKIKLEINVRKINNLLNNPEATLAYAKLKDYLYGGINLPMDRDILEFVKTIEAEFSGYSEEEIKILIKEIRKNGIDNDPYKTNLLIKILKELPYIRKNYENIDMKLSRKRKTSKYNS